MRRLRNLYVRALDLTARVSSQFFVRKKKTGLFTGRVETRGLGRMGANLTRLDPTPDNFECLLARPDPDPRGFERPPDRTRGPGHDP